MKRNAKTIIAGMIALAISRTAIADDIKVAVVGAMSGPDCSGAIWNLTARVRQLKTLMPKGELWAINWLAWNMTTPATRNKPLRSANKIVNDGIKYVIGHLCSSSTQPASDIYEDEGILMISPGATNPELTQPRLSIHHAYCRAGLFPANGGKIHS